MEVLAGLGLARRPVHPILCGYSYFFKTDPRFLETRLDDREQVGEQKQLIRWSGPLFVVAFLLPGLDHRFGWSQRLHLAVPLWLTLLSLAMALAAILLVLWVMNVNRYAAHTIQVVAGQTVISSGPYRFVRHPLYSGAALLWVFTPLALGSFVALPAFVLLESFYVIRLLNEEKLLRASLQATSSTAPAPACAWFPSSGKRRGDSSRDSQKQPGCRGKLPPAPRFPSQT